MDGLTEGRMVHYVMPSHQHRPAIIVKVWDHTGNTGTSNLTVFVDGRNDVKMEDKDWDPKNPDVLLMRYTSVVYSEDPQPSTWHWIEKA